MFKDFNKKYFSEFFLRGPAFVLRSSVIFRERWKKTEGVFALLALVAVSVFFFVGYVKADTNVTTVTVGNSVPTLAVTMDRTTITLTENSFTWASATVTVTDGNGCSTIADVTAQLAFGASGSTTAAADGSTCSYDGTYCYASTTGANGLGCVATTTGTTCATTVVDYDCGFQIWYNAYPTDGSSPSPGNATEYWYVTASSSDGTDTGTATNTTQTVDVGTLNALAVTGSIAYSQTSANADTGTTDQTVTITNTGNTAGDTEVSGDVMCTTFTPPGGSGACSGDSFLPGQQKFDLASGQDYTTQKTFTLAATSSPASIETVLATSTATTTAITDDTYWGIGIPSGQANGAYTGENTFTAVAD